MKKIFSIKSEFGKNVVTLLSGSVIGQAIVFVFIPLLARLYDKDLFGIYYIFIASFNILKKVSTLRFELAIVISKNDKRAINSLAISVIILTATSLFFILIALLLKLFNFDCAWFSKLYKFIYLLIAVLFFSGMTEILNAWNNRLKQYKKISLTKLVYSGTLVSGQSGLSFTFLQKTGLILGNVIARLLTMTTILLASFKEIKLNLKYLNIRLMKAIFFRFIKIPVYNTLINVVNNLSNELPIYMFSFLFSPAISGFYGMANKLFATPADLIGNSISQVFYQQASDNFVRRQKLFPLIKRTHRNIFKIVLLFTIGYLAITPFIHILLGSKWQGIAMYLFMIIPIVISNMFLQPISPTYTILEKQNKVFLWQIIALIVRGLSIALGFWIFHSVFYALLFLMITTTIYKISMVWWLRKISR